MVGIQGFGTYYFFFAEGILSIIFVWFFLPETKGRALEELDAIFNLPWHKIGRVGRLTVDQTGDGLTRIERPNKMDEEQEKERDDRRVETV